MFLSKKKIFTGNDFFKSIKWSPDAKHLLVSSEDQNIYIITPQLESTIIKKNEIFDTIHSISWLTNEKYLALKKDCPIQLFDSFNLDYPPLASYSTISPLNGEFHSVLSFCCSNLTLPSHPPPSSTSNILLAGGREELWMFDIETAKSIGYWRTRQSRAHKDELSGWISALSLRQDHILAAGTFNGHLSIYDCRIGGNSQFNLDVNDTSTDNLNDPILGECLLKCQDLNLGITQIVNDNQDGWDLMVATRKSSILHIYDLRNGLIRDQIEMGPHPSTNQRFEFAQGEIDNPPNNQQTGNNKEKLFIRGGADGNLHLYQRNSNILSNVSICNDAIGGVDYCPNFSLTGNKSIAVCTGSRHYSSSISSSNKDQKNIKDEGDDFHDYGVYILDFQN